MQFLLYHYHVHICNSPIHLIPSFFCLIFPPKLPLLMNSGRAPSYGGYSTSRASGDIFCSFSLHYKQNQSQPSLSSGAKDQPSQQQCARSSECKNFSGHSEHHAVEEPFDIFLPRTGTSVMLKSSLFARNRDKRKEIKRALELQGHILKPGMVILKGYLSIDDQTLLGPGGFYQPGYHDDAKMHFRMMCLGRNWDPNTSMHGEHQPIDGAKPPEIPQEFCSLVDKAMKDSCALIERNSKATNEGEFLYCDNRDEKNAMKVILESGDVLIFGGKSRHIFHGIRSVHPNAVPRSLLEETNLRPGCLNLTFIQY
ncbi:hypothetical protein P3X46_001638 [Hevea brasiliensis]|uniref:Alpha-ketoglutarate-dependent dioxygenase AlkB-like domain-containing protein n=1 Tax=Hevea brasiliensis TaxID=3981 RepID=A0ABQ9NIY2_HEVBR|nr:hypothetical protein P3X46_001638 [Hevea brasiliensis]